MRFKRSQPTDMQEAEIEGGAASPASHLKNEIFAGVHAAGAVDFLPNTSFDFNQPSCAVGPDPGLVSSSSSTSLHSSASFQSEASSILHKRQRRENFRSLLAERSFEILSRKTKFVLSVFAAGKIRFVDRIECK